MEIVHIGISQPKRVSEHEEWRHVMVLPNNTGNLYDLDIPSVPLTSLFTLSYI